jgi:hypothetical protein
MGYTDKHGRPELVAQPFIYKGAAEARVVDTSDVDEDETVDEATQEPADREDDDTSPA